MANLIVFGPTWSVVVQAKSYEQAKERVLQDQGLAARPWLARDWVIRIASDREVEAHERRVAKTRRVVAAVQGFERLPLPD
jgi:hypothetical protein